MKMKIYYFSMYNHGYVTEEYVKSNKVKEQILLSHSSELATMYKTNE